MKHLSKLCATLLFATCLPFADAQTANDATTVGTEKTDPIAPTTSQSPDTILRLQDTIRANTEQPQVLSIVPWQLPTHKRIENSADWQPLVNTVPVIERSQFLRELRLSTTLSKANNIGLTRDLSTDPNDAQPER
ncbi:hypothetical protein [Agaribacter flavus]|uniref:Uncharacterized protein n=1 Tax=Agaribacter flavus TaxID=1902781 RepID=A0ABV7FSM1_9ALTE